jgi:hypothetical protein
MTTTQYTITGGSIMTMPNSKAIDISDSGVGYDVACECINLEIALHHAAIYAIGNDDGPQVQRRLESVRYLIEARQLLDPDQPETVRIVLLLLKGIRGHEVPRTREA